jgi:hypothetical protein
MFNGSRRLHSPIRGRSFNAFEAATIQVEALEPRVEIAFILYLEVRFDEGDGPGSPGASARSAKPDDEAEANRSKEKSSGGAINGI